MVMKLASPAPAAPTWTGANGSLVPFFVMWGRIGGK
jgi:hypothetical protein